MNTLLTSLKGATRKLKETLPDVFQKLAITRGSADRDDSDILFHLMHVASIDVWLQFDEGKIRELDANSILFYHLAAHLKTTPNFACLLYVRIISFVAAISCYLLV